MIETIKYGDKEFEKYIPAWEVKNIVSRLARNIKEDYRDQAGQVVLISILDGSFIFMADLVRLLDFEIEIQFVKLRSYHDTESTGEVETVLNIQDELEGKHVIVIEDVVDTGLTIESLLEQIRERNPASVKICALLSKPDEHNDIFEIDYVGLEIPPVFVVGYGLDLNGRGRNLRDIYKLVV